MATRLSTQASMLARIAGIRDLVHAKAEFELNRAHVAAHLARQTQRASMDRLDGAQTAWSDSMTGRHCDLDAAVAWAAVADLEARSVAQSDHDVAAADRTRDSAAAHNRAAQTAAEASANASRAANRRLALRRAELQIDENECLQGRVCADAD